MRRTVFVHGSGRAGVEAWPLQADWPRATFLTRPGFAEGDAPRRTDLDAEPRLVNEACGEGSDVIAHSYGAIAAIAAAGRADTAVRTLVLCEPAAFSLGRGRPAVEAHIAAVDPVMRARLSPADFYVALLSSLGAVDPEPPDSVEALIAAERMALQVPPWDVDLDPRVIARIPTLVVTGNWNAEYEELAEVLVELGAHHEHLEGHGHRPQDADGFRDVVDRFRG